jgi:NADH-ubiquinone oxidoreductase chain 1
MYSRTALSVIITFIIALLAIAFYTLVERKILGYCQLRKGPNKVRLIGVPQPLADAIKLLTKEKINPSAANLIPFFISPILRLILALALWVLYPFTYASIFFSFGTLYFLCVSRTRVYTILAAG